MAENFDPLQYLKDEGLESHLPNPEKAAAEIDRLQPYLKGAEGKTALSVRHQIEDQEFNRNIHGRILNASTPEEVESLLNEPTTRSSIRKFGLGLVPEHEVRKLVGDVPHFQRHIDDYYKAAKPAYNTYRQEHGKSFAGWKLHLNTSDDPADPFAQEVSSWLGQRNIHHKIGNGGEASEGKGMTVYVGGHEETQHIADELHKAFSDRLGTSPAGSDVVKTERAYHSGIYGRFVVQGDPRFHQYGSHGVSHLMDDRRKHYNGMFTGVQLNMAESAEKTILNDPKLAELYGPARFGKNKLVYSSLISKPGENGVRAIQTVAHHVDEEPNFKHLASHAGWAWGTYDPHSKSAHLESTGVEKGWTGRGVGQELLGEFGNQAEALGAHSLTGDVSNPRALTNRLKVFGEKSSELFNPTTGASLAMTPQEALEKFRDAQEIKNLYIRTKLNPVDRRAPKLEAQKLGDNPHAVARYLMEREHPEDGPPEKWASWKERTGGQDAILGRAQDVRSKAIGPREEDEYLRRAERAGGPGDREALLDEMLARRRPTETLSDKEVGRLKERMPDLKDQLPAVEEGKVRLFRGEGPLDARIAARNVGEEAKQGGWWTPDLDYAHGYAMAGYRPSESDANVLIGDNNRRGAGGRILYRDFDPNEIPGEVKGQRMEEHLLDARFRDDAHSIPLIPEWAGSGVPPKAIGPGTGPIHGEVINQAPKVEEEAAKEEPRIIEASARIVSGEEAPKAAEEAAAKAAPKAAAEEVGAATAEVINEAPRAAKAAEEIITEAPKAAEKAASTLRPGIGKIVDLAGEHPAGAAIGAVAALAAVFALGHHKKDGGGARASISEQQPQKPDMSGLMTNQGNANRVRTRTRSGRGGIAYLG